MRILKHGSNFNPETSIVVKKLNPKCSEVDLIQEINQIFHYNKTYRKEIRKWEDFQKKEKKKPGLFEDLNQYFVLGCTVVKTTQFRFAIIDLDCHEATQVLIKAWHQRNMETYDGDVLEVSMYDSDFKKQR
jgi:hypothetical protein